MNSQEAAFEKLSKLKCGALFMEMGTGKTKVALDLIASKRAKIDYVLWILPLSTKEDIEAERAKWHPEIAIDFVGVETLSQSGRVFVEKMATVSSRRSFVVVDESLKIKNADAIRTRRALDLGAKAAYRLILNGTPISKNALDLWPQMQFLSPKILNMTSRRFKDTYCEYYLHGKLRGMVKRDCNVPNLISLIEPYIFDSSLYIGKDKEYESKGYSIEDPVRYREIKDDFVHEYMSDGSSSFLALAAMLQQCYCSGQAKKEAVEAEAAKEPCLVFVKYLSSIPEGSARLTGEERDRGGIIGAFRSGAIHHLYVTYGLGAFGLNFQNCRKEIFADHTFDYATRIQAEARIFRMGQTKDVKYVSFDCDCGLDDMIRACLAKKSSLLSEIKKEITERGLEQWAKGI